MTPQEHLKAALEKDEYVLSKPQFNLFESLLKAAKATSEAIEFVDLIKRSKIIQDVLIQYGDQKRNEVLGELEKWAIESEDPTCRFSVNSLLVKIQSLKT